MQDSEKTKVAKSKPAQADDTVLSIEDALVGHTLGVYQLTERLGQGGMATVYKAYEPALDRYVAVKVLPQFFANDPNFIERFRREAKAVAQLNHPAIVPIYSYGEDKGITYIAMQYVPGGTLKQLRGQVYSPKDAIRLVLPVVQALAFAHQRGIIHRDIKPSNVLLSDGKWPLLADFGLAKMVENSGQLTGTGVGVGTPMYMSPEQGEGHQVDQRTDIYSLGIMLYEMLTGDVPFRADTPMAIVIKHMTAPMPMPRAINPAIPEALERVILKATAKASDDRYQTADELAQALESVQTHLGQDAVSPGQQTVTTMRSPVVEDTSVTPRGNWLRKVGFTLLAALGILLLGVVLMGVFDICPPPGPWPIPPWCEGSPYKLPSFGKTDAPAPTPMIAEGVLGGILFQDDFEGSISPRWQFTAEHYLNPWQADTFEGRSVMRTVPPSQAGGMNAAEIRGTSWENYAIQFDFYFEKPDQFGVYYFWLRGRVTDCPPTVPSLQTYSLMISPDKIWVDKATCQAGSGYILEESDRDFALEGWHTLQYIFIGNRIQVYIDGEKYFDYTDADEPFGGGDLWIETTGETQLLFDNLIIYEVVADQ